MDNSYVLWAAEKKVKESDLPFVQLLKTTPQQLIYQQLANKIATLRPSYSEGLSVLELVAELILLGYQKELFFHLDTLKGYKDFIRKIRYPLTTSQDDLLKIKFKNLPWPQGSKVQFERRGDRAGVEFKFFVSSQTDISKLIAALERVQAEMKMDLNN